MWLRRNEKFDIDVSLYWPIGIKANKYVFTEDLEPNIIILYL